MRAIAFALLTPFYFVQGGLLVLAAGGGRRARSDRGHHLTPIKVGAKNLIQGYGPRSPGSLLRPGNPEANCDPP